MIEVETPQEIEVITNGVEVEARTLDVEVVDLSELDITVAKREFVITGDDIYVPKLYDDAPQWMKDLVDIVVNNAMETGNAATLNEMTSMLSQFAVSYVPLNQYTQSILDLSNEDARINSVIETLNSNFNDGLSEANAQIINVQNTKASKDEVIAQVITTLSAQLANPTSELGATIGRIDQTIVNNQSANALSMQVLTSTLEGLGEDVSGNSTALQALSTYVGIEEGTPTGTGLLADVAILQTQVDGQVSYYFYDSALGQTAASVSGSASWTTDTLKRDHNGDIAYDTTLKVGYWYDRTTASWVQITGAQNAGVIEALKRAAAAKEAADSVIVSYYAWKQTTAPTTQYKWMKDDNTLWEYVGSSWIAVDVKKDDTLTAYDNTTKDTTLYVHNGSNWAMITPNGLVANAKAVTDLNASLTSMGTTVSGHTSLLNTVDARIGTEGARVESKFGYDSSLVLNGTTYNSGFGIATSLTAGSGLPTGQSEFWIKADKFKLMSADGSKKSSYSPFTVDSATGEINFNGKVSFSNVTGYTPPDVSGDINANNDVFAQKLGYINYAAMVAAAASGQTVISGGYINTELININSTEDNSSLIIDKDGLRIIENGVIRAVIGRIV